MNNKFNTITLAVIENKKEYPCVSNDGTRLLRMCKGLWPWSWMLLFRITPFFLHRLRRLCSRIKSEIDRLPWEYLPKYLRFSIVCDGICLPVVWHWWQQYNYRYLLRETSALRVMQEKRISYNYIASDGSDVFLVRERFIVYLRVFRVLLVYF